MKKFTKNIKRERKQILAQSKKQKASTQHLSVMEAMADLFKQKVGKIISKYCIKKH